MKVLFILLFISQAMILCSQPGSARTGRDNKRASRLASGKVQSPDIASLTKDFQTWYNYTYYHVRLANNFIPLDVDSNPISKKDFLAKMITGNGVPFEAGNSNGSPIYRLYELPNISPDIRQVSQSAARQELANFTMEGTELPDFTFTDVNGIVYSKANTKGKLIMLKCWFIHCVACVAEFPKLNQLADDYKDKKDVLFISLAKDAKQDLIGFLQKKPFGYAVVPLQENYMNAEGINMYPTHILVGRDGKIIKVTNDIDDMMPALQEAVAKKI